MADAARAAAALGVAGVPVVLLYGSVARGTQRADSDIDLVAMFDDLNYAERWRRKAELGVLASQAAGRPVQVRVTDRPEWQRRSRGMRTSFEAGIVGDVVVLRDRPATGVNWHKEIGMPTSDFGEAVRSLGNTNKALHDVRAKLEPDVNEREALAGRDALHYLVAVADRLRGVCADSHLAMENALKSLVHAYCEEPPGRTHRLDGLVARLPEWLEPAAVAALGDLNAPAVVEWRERGAYPGDFPDLTLDELARTAHALAAAACALGRLAAEHVTAAGAAVVSPDPGTPRPAAWEASRAAHLTAAIEQAIAGWDLAQETPAAQMGIPAPPEPSESLRPDGGDAAPEGAGPSV